LTLPKPSKQRLKGFMSANPRIYQAQVPSVQGLGRQPCAEGVRGASFLVQRISVDDHLRVQSSKGNAPKSISNAVRACGG
jgi:hypothetical protein